MSMLRKAAALSITLVAIGVGCIGYSHAQLTMMTGAGKGTNTVAGYTGPGDIVSGWTAWWGLRGYSAAYSIGSNPAADICDTATGATCVTANITSAGDLDTSGLGTVCAVSCSIKQLYDQTGNGFHVFNANPSERPVLTSGILAKRVAAFVSANGTNLEATGLPGLSIPVSAYAVAERTSNFTTVGLIISAQSVNTAQFGFNSTTGQVFSYNGGASSFTAVASDSAFHSINFVMNGASSATDVDGSRTTGVLDTAGFSNPPRLGDSFGGTSNISFDGYLCQAGIHPTAISSGNASTLSTNDHTYWGF